MKKLVVIDYSTNKVHLYNIDRKAPIDDDYIESIGHNTNQCYWIAGNIEILKHSGVLL